MFTLLNKNIRENFQLNMILSSDKVHKNNFIHLKNFYIVINNIGVVQ